MSTINTVGLYSNGNKILIKTHKYTLDIHSYTHREIKIGALISSSGMAERPRELGDFKKARINGGTDNHSLKGFSQLSPLPLTDPHHMVIK